MKHSRPADIERTSMAIIAEELRQRGILNMQKILFLQKMQFRWGLRPFERERPL